MHRVFRQKTSLVFLILALAGTEAAFAQTTQPSQNTWQTFVSAATSELAVGDADNFQLRLTSDCPIHPFTSKESGDSNKLFDALSGQTLLVARAYTGTPTTLAEDLAADVAASSVPNSVKKFLALPDDDNRRKSAADTALNWATSALNLSPNDPMAVIVFYTPTTIDDPAQHPIFVLIKGVEVAPDQYKVAAVVFGDPVSD